MLCICSNGRNFLNISNFFEWFVRWTEASSAFQMGFQRTRTLSKFSTFCFQSTVFIELFDSNFSVISMWSIRKVAIHFSRNVVQVFECQSRRQKSVSELWSFCFQDQISSRILRKLVKLFCVFSAHHEKSYQQLFLEKFNFSLKT